MASDNIDNGHFRAAELFIAEELADPDTTPADREALLFQRERMRRILLDFPLREAEMRAKLREAIPDLREDEFRAWDDANLLEHLSIDGEKRYFARSVSNLWRLSPAAVARGIVKRPEVRAKTFCPFLTHRVLSNDVRYYFVARGRRRFHIARRFVERCNRFLKCSLLTREPRFGISAMEAIARRAAQAPQGATKGKTVRRAR